MILSKEVKTGFTLLSMIVMQACVISKHSNIKRAGTSQIYNHFNVKEINDAVIDLIPIPCAKAPLWARNVSQQKWDWNISQRNPKIAFFKGPIPYVLPPDPDSGEPFYRHNHEPAITWLINGDLLAIWFSTTDENGTEMTVLASRLRAGKHQWDSSSEFFKAEGRNMTGMSLFTDSSGKIYHFNGMGPEEVTGWDNLALIMRASKDNGMTWDAPRAIAPKFEARNQVIDGTIETSGGMIIQPCDATPRAKGGGTALHMSSDGGKTWFDPGKGKPFPKFIKGVAGEGTIAGIHAQVVELKDGRLMALGRSSDIDGKMPMSISSDMGKTWLYSASPFSPITSGQRIVLIRLKEGPILLVTFANAPMSFLDEKGVRFDGIGMFAALSYDDGKSWPVRKLITPGIGYYNGQGWTDWFHTTPNQAEPKGYLSAIQSPDNIIHLISSGLYYRFNLKWIETRAESNINENE